MTPRRRGQVALSRDSIVSAALRLVDAEGSAALTMRRLGAELDVDASSLYYHVPRKAALEDLVVDAVMGEVPLEPAEKRTDSVIEQVMAFVHALAETLLAHPRAIPLFGARSLTSPASLVPVEYLLAVLHEGGLDYPHAIAAVNDIFFFVLGSTSGRSAQLFDPQHQAKALAALRELPASEFPHLTAAMGSPLIKKSVEFEMGARALVCGLIGDIKDEQKEPGGPLIRVQRQFDQGR